MCFLITFDFRIDEDSARGLYLMQRRILQPSYFIFSKTLVIIFMGNSKQVYFSDDKCFSSVGYMPVFTAVKGSPARAERATLYARDAFKFLD